MNGRLERLEKNLLPAPGQAVVLCPTDQEYEAYQSGKKPLPDAKIEWNLSLMSDELLEKIIQEGEIAGGPPSSLYDIEE